MKQEVNAKLEEGAPKMQTAESNITITAIDRFYIPKAGEATKDIKMHILKLMDMID